MSKTAASSSKKGQPKVVKPFYLLPDQARISHTSVETALVYLSNICRKLEAHNFSKHTQEILDVLNPAKDCLEELEHHFDLAMDIVTALPSEDEIRDIVGEVITETIGKRLSKPKQLIGFNLLPEQQTEISKKRQKH